jgi:CubicO group peptidase (beta-lactamase class C family)
MAESERIDPYVMRYTLVVLTAALLVFLTVALLRHFTWPVADDVNPRRADPKSQVRHDPAAADVRAKLRTILDEQREKQHIPGLAFVVVSDDKVLFLETLGLRDLDRKLPVTPDTVFPIGSCTKSFTSVAAAASHDKGVLTLDDSPHKYLPYFRMADPEADALVTLRDMLCHRTGLRAKADLAAVPAVLSREEYVRAATSAKPSAKLRAKFQYSNAMFTAAGEAIAKANHTTWERLIETTIFEPLHMTSSLTSAEPPAERSDRALGYVYREASKDWKQVPPTKSLAAMAPAGAIASTARDMSQWLRFLTTGGTIDGKRIISEAALQEIARPHIAINDTLSYGLGWATYKWNGHTVVEHNGGGQGISALVTFVPRRRVGFAILANTSPNYMTAIGNAGRLLWPLILGGGAPPPTTTASTAPATPSPPGAVPSGAALPTVDELFARMVAAYGGERNLRRHSCQEVRARKVYEHQGVQADLVILARAPHSRSEEETWTAVGKPIGRYRTFFDGARGGQETTFGQDATYAGDEVEQRRRDSALHAILEVRTLYHEVKVERKATLAGEDTYVVRLTPKRGSPVLLYVSSRTALIVQRETNSQTATFGDYRNVDGEFVPFRTTIRDALGEATIEVRDVRFNGSIPPTAFSASDR